MKRIINCIIILCMMILICGCADKTNSQEIVWYVPNGTFGYLDDNQLYKPIHNDVIDELAKILENKGADFSIVFKSYGDDIEFSNWDFIDLLKEKDDHVDILKFEKINYNDYLVLDDELKKEEFSSLLNIFPKQAQITQKINGNTYQIPKPSVLWSQPIYSIDSSFMEDANLTPQFFKRNYIDIMNDLMNKLEKNINLQNKYRIDSSTISLSELNQDAYKSITECSSNFFEGIVIRKSDCKIVNIYEDPILREQLKINQEIYSKNIDKHINQEDTPNIIEVGYDYPKEYIQDDLSDVTRIPIGDFYATQAVGYGILKTSQNKNAALEALQMVYTDQDISNLLIYGIENKDYHIEDKRAVTTSPNKNMMAVGTMAELGNNLIAFPSPLEPLNKKELADKYNAQLPYDKINGFVPDLSHIKEEYSQLTEMYWDTLTKINYSHIENVDNFYEEVNRKLYDMGLQSVIDELQKQLDKYMEKNNET